MNSASFLDLLTSRRGHFRLESGHHSDLWFDLDALFADPRRVAPFVTSLADALRPYEIAAVCGPLVGGAFLAQLLAPALGIEWSFTERIVQPAVAGLYRAKYRLPRAFVTRHRGARVAIVDDVMSAGSALKGTYEELVSHGGVPVVAGALLVLGAAGARFFADHDVPVEAVSRDDFNLWQPHDCPLCRAGSHVEEIVTAPC